MGSKREYNTKAVTRHIREIGEEADAIVSETAGSITRNQALAHLLWKIAFGWEETVTDEAERNEDGTFKIRKVRHQPQQWAIVLLIDRQEGKTPQAIDDDAGRISVADRVDEVRKNQLNAIAIKHGKEAPPGPPDFKRETPDG